MAQRVTAKVKGLSERAAYWRKMIGKWRRSGQTPEAFCRQRHLKVGTFVWWKPRLEKAAKELVPPTDSESTAFVEVRRPQAKAEVASRQYEVVLTNHRRIVASEGFDEGALGRLIRVVETC